MVVSNTLTFLGELKRVCSTWASRPTTRWNSVMLPSTTRVSMASMSVRSDQGVSCRANKLDSI